MGNASADAPERASDEPRTIVNTFPSRSNVMRPAAWSESTRRAISSAYGSSGAATVPATSTAGIDAVTGFPSMSTVTTGGVRTAGTLT